MKIKGILVFLAGACAGGAGVYFGLKKKMQADFDSKLNEISSFYVNKYVKKDVETAADVCVSMVKETSGEGENMFKMGDIKPGMKVVSSLDGNEFATENYKKSYSSMFVGDGKINGNLADPRTPVAEVVEELGPKFPLRITRGMYEEDKNYRKVCLTYYEESAVFATLDDVESEYTEDYFGLENLSKFGGNFDEEYDDDAYTLHFRSEADKTDFELYYEPTLSWDEVKMNSGGER